MPPFLLQSEFSDVGRFLGSNIAIAKAGFFGPSNVLPPGVWTLRTGYPLANVRTLTGNATRMVVLDGAGGVAYSDNHGATWHLGSGLSSIDGQAIATNGINLWIVSSSTGNIYTSTDGATWTHAVDIGPLQGQPSIVYGNGLFVLGAQSSSQVVNVYTSTNGTAWTGHGTSTPSEMFVQVFDGTNFVASAIGASAEVVFNANPVSSAWTVTSTPQFVPNNNVIVIGYNGGVYVGTDQEFPSVVQQSPSPTWSGTNLTQPLSDDVQGVTYGQGVWCLVGDVTGTAFPQAATSPDLINFTLEDLDMGAAGHEGLVGVLPAGGALVAWTSNNLLSTRN